MSLASKIKSRLFPEDELTSISLRARFAQDHDVHVGLYSYGCFDPKRIGRNTKIGRYCSFSPTSYVFRRNHGVNYLGLTAYFYNSSLGVVEADTIPHQPLEIMDDVWLGHNCTVLPSVSRIGRGAVIGAGAVVTRDVEPYSIVVGNPATSSRQRFDARTIEKLERSRWWELTPEQLKKAFTKAPELVLRPSEASEQAWELIYLERTERDGGLA